MPIYGDSASHNQRNKRRPFPVAVAVVAVAVVAVAVVVVVVVVVDDGQGDRDNDTVKMLVKTNSKPARLVIEKLETSYNRCAAFFSFK